VGIQIVGAGGAVAEVGEFSQSALQVTGKPIPADGHYRVTHRCVLVATQAANSRLFEMRQPTAGKLLILTRLIIKWMNSAAHTAFIEDSLDCFKVTTFTAVDTTNTVTLTSSAKRTSMAADIAVIRGVTVAGAAAGMTGGTLTKDAGPWAQLPRILNQTVEATTETTSRTADTMEALDPGEDTHPFVFAQNEGFIVENRVLLGAAAGSSVYIDVAYAIADAY
jgi:hypothetical protein